MRVAIARYRYSPHGGGERYLDALAERLRETGADLRILSSSWERAEMSGSSWVPLRVPNRPAPVRLFLFARAVRQWARAHPDWLLFSWERLPGTEVYRAGIESVHPSQRMAARSLGLSYTQALRFVILPQAVRRVIPPLLNDFIGLQKDTALITVLGLTEAAAQAGFYSSDYFNYAGFTVAAVFFIILTIPLARFTDHLVKERELRERAQAV